MLPFFFFGAWFFTVFTRHARFSIGIFESQQPRSSVSVPLQLPVQAPQGVRTPGGAAQPIYCCSGCRTGAWQQPGEQLWRRNHLFLLHAEGMKTDCVAPGFAGQYSLSFFTFAYTDIMELSCLNFKLLSSPFLVMAKEWDLGVRHTLDSRGWHAGGRPAGNAALPAGARSPPVGSTGSSSGSPGAPGRSVGSQHGCQPWTSWSKLLLTSHCAPPRLLTPLAIPIN